MIRGLLFTVAFLAVLYAVTYQYSKAPKWVHHPPLYADGRCQDVLAKWIPRGAKGRIDMNPAQFQGMYAEMAACMKQKANAAE